MEDQQDLKKNKNNSFYEFKDDQDIKSEEDEGEEPVQQPEEKNEENKEGDGEGEQVKKKKTTSAKFYAVFITIILTLVWNMFILYPMKVITESFKLIYNIFTAFCGEFNLKQKIINPILSVVFSLSIIYVCYQTIEGVINSKDDVYVFWFIDSFFLFLSHIMIYTIIQMSINDEFDLDFKKIFDCSGDNQDVLLIHADDFDCDLIMDIPLGDDEWQYEYTRIMGEVLEVDVKSQRFNTFANPIKHIQFRQYVGYQLIKGQNQKLRPHMGQFITLQVLALLKTLFCVTYIVYHFRTFTLKDLLNTVCITLFTTNEIYCLSSMLSNYDLRRKTLMIKNITESLVIKGQKASYENAIDLTNSESIETWDNTRRCIYEFFSETQQKLERSYICLFIYYIFIANIILAAYGEIFLVIKKDSILLQNLTVVSSTFTFILLNTLIFFRIYFGSKFNETFEDLQDKVENIIGIYQDMAQMYDYNFKQRGVTIKDYINIVKYYQGEDQEEESERQSQKQQSQEIVKENTDTASVQKDKDLLASTIEGDMSYYTCYEILVSKIMYISEYYIKHKQPFQGQIYTKDQESQLQMKIILNCIKSLKRIKQQIIVDSKCSSYQIFNLLKLDFKDTLFTLLLGFATLLPSIISKFIDQFSSTIEQPKA
ncbi:hypothetical protein ABPG72_015368 [Tetrahymena utriculariae]